MSAGAGGQKPQWFSRRISYIPAQTREKETASKPEIISSMTQCQIKGGIGQTIVLAYFLIEAQTF